jgi:hypothetical protein
MRWHDVVEHKMGHSSVDLFNPTWRHVLFGKRNRKLIKYLSKRATMHKYLSAIVFAKSDNFLLKKTICEIITTNIGKKRHFSYYASEKWPVGDHGTTPFLANGRGNASYIAWEKINVSFLYKSQRNTALYFIKGTLLVDPVVRVLLKKWIIFLLKFKQWFSILVCK